MRRLARIAAALALAFTLAPAESPGAQSLDPAAGEALAAAMKMLLDPTQRAAAITGNPQAGPIDQDIRALTRSDALTQELYALAADVFRDLALASGGDSTKIAQTLERARTDPAGFAAGLSPQTLERLRQLSIRISDQPR